jgi:hypothetical protein
MICWVSQNDIINPNSFQLYVFGQNIDTYPTRGTEKLIEYKTYLQALPYFDRLEGDCEIIK